MEDFSRNEGRRHRKAEQRGGEYWKYHCRELGEVPHLWKMGQDHPWIHQRGVPRLSFVFPYTTSPGMGKAWALCSVPCLSQ